MAKIKIRTLEETPVVTSPWQTSGRVETHCYFDGDDDPIHLRLFRLSPGAELSLAGAPSDLSVYVRSGSVDAGGTRLETRASAIVEFGASHSFTASPEGADLLVFHLRERPGDARAGQHVHLLPNDRVPRTDAFYGNDGIAGGIHADAQCPTCRIWLHEQGFALPDNETALHSHSEDEVIFVTSGAMRLGRKTYGPGTALAIHADAKYAFWSGPEGLGFVNFRGASPTYTAADGSSVLDEAELWCSELGHPQYITTPA